MGQMLISIEEAPSLPATPDIVSTLETLSSTYGDVLKGSPLYEEDEGQIYLFGIRTGESFDVKRGQSPWTIDFLWSLSGDNPGLPAPLFDALCKVLRGQTIYFRQDFGDGSYMNNRFEFGARGVSGEISSYELDYDSDEYKRVSRTRVRLKKNSSDKSKAPSTEAKKKSSAQAVQPAAAPATRKKAARASKPAPVGGGIAGKTFLFTGTLTTMTRAEAEQRVKAEGGTVLSAVRVKLDYLVAGEKAGSKLAKAKKISSIVILSESDFQAL